MHKVSQNKILVEDNSTIAVTSLVARVVKVSAYNVGDPSLIPGLGRFPWTGKWQPTPVLLPGKSHGWRSLQSMGSQRVG